jgi:Flp pilus assembly protein TadD
MVLNRCAIGVILAACCFLGGCATQQPAVVRTAEGLSQADVDALIGQAEQEIAQGNYTQAIAAYERVVAASPRNAQAWFRLGTARVKARQMRMAQYAFERALQIEPTMAKAQANLALTHLHEFRVAAAPAIASEQVSDANRATLRSLMRDVNQALFPAPTLTPAGTQ